MAEVLEDTQGLESTTIGIYRTAATVKGGRRFSFGALVVVGDRGGGVAIGYGKAPGVPAAIEKAQKQAKKNITRVNLQEGTIPHEVTGRFLSSAIKLVPASPGTGVIAGTTARAVLEMAGVRDCLTKSIGSTNQKNLAKATIEGLLALRDKATIQELRGVEIQETRVERILEAGRRYAPTASPTQEKAKGPVAKKPDEKGKGRGRGRGGGGRPRGGRGRGRAPAQRGAAGREAPPAQAPAAKKPEGGEPGESPKPAE